MIKKDSENHILLFAMKNFLLEAELKKIEESGIDIGHIETLKKDEVVDTEIFETEILKSAKKMANFYVLYFAMENSIRKLITDVLNEKYGINWWELKVPDGVKTQVKDKQKKEKDTAMTIRSEDSLTYTNFGELIDIINANWIDFQEIIRSQKSMQDTLTQFNRIRNVIAHSCLLADDEIFRLKILIKDWLRIQT